VYWQNRCCDLEEIIELFCMDAADALREVLGEMKLNQIDNIMRLARRKGMK